MPPRTLQTAAPTRVHVHVFDFAGRRVKPAVPQHQADEPSPMMEAIHQYLDSLA